MPTISCPHCGAERNTPRAKLPTKKTPARCPQCRNNFIFDPAEVALPRRTSETATCPHCGLERPVPVERAEFQAKTASCRRCNRSFRIQAGKISHSHHPGLRSIGHLLTDSWELFFHRGWGLLSIYLTVSLLSLAPLLAITLLKPDLWFNQQQQNWHWPILLIAAGYLLLSLSWLTGSMFIHICKPGRGSFGSIALGLRRSSSFTFLLILLGLIVGGGSLLLLIPGLLFCTWFLFCQYILADEDIGGLQALEKSRMLTSGYRWAIFIRFALLLVIALALSFLTARIPHLGGAANLVFCLLLTPFSLLYCSLIYNDLKASYQGPQRPPIKNQWLPVTTAAFGWMLIPGLLLANHSRQSLLAEEALSAANPMLQIMAGQTLQPPPPKPQQPETAENLNHSDYQRLLANQRKASSGDELNLGPVTLHADRFWPDDREPHLWLKLELDEFPNLKLAQKGSARIEIDKVLDTADRDRYDRQHSFEHPAFHWISTTQIDESRPPSGIRNIYLQQGTRAEEVRTITGKLELTLPLAIESLQLTHKDIGKTLDVAGKQLVLQQLEANAINLRYFGDRNALLNVQASSAAGQLREVGFTWQQSGDAFDLRQMFDGNIDSITVLVAGDTLRQSYPFKLTR